MAKARVLLVEDSPINRHLVSRVLRDKGFDVTAVSDGPDALTAARSGAPDVIVLDLELPTLDGWAVATSLKGDSKTARHYSRVRNYVAVNRAAVREMHRQVGDLVLDRDGVAVRGLLARHLVLPAGLANTAAVPRFIASEIRRIRLRQTAWSSSVNETLS